MKCQTVRIILSAIQDGEATEAERHRAENHLASCSECRDTLTSFQQTDARFRELAPQSLEDGVWEQLLPKLEEPREPLSRQHWLRSLGHYLGIQLHGRQKFWAGGAFAAVVSALLLIFLLPRKTDFATAPKTVERVPTAFLAKKQLHRHILAQDDLSRRLDHYLNRARILLLDIQHYDPDAQGWRWQETRSLAQNLWEEISLLRGDLKIDDAAQRSLLKELEVVLLEVANLGEDPNLPEILTLKETVEEAQLAMKIALFHSRWTQIMAMPTT